MAFTPNHPTYAGLLPIQEAAKGIIERDFVEALAWRCGLDGSTPGENFARVQLMPMHSREFPLLVIRAVTSDPEPITGGKAQNHTLIAEISLVKEVAGTNPVGQVDDLAKEVTRYSDAAMMAWESAPSDDWQGNFPDDSQGKVRVFCRNFIYGSLLTAKEEAGKYAASIAFEVSVQLLESEG